MGPISKIMKFYFHLDFDSVFPIKIPYDISCLHVLFSNRFHLPCSSYGFQDKEVKYNVVKICCTAHSNKVN